MLCIGMTSKHIFTFIILVILIAFALEDEDQSSASKAEKDNVSEGYATIQDGDSLKINNVKHRLFGIDAPELDQYCDDSQGNEYKCGIASKAALAELVKNKKIKCLSHEKDRYNREIAVCYIGKTDINGWLVENGYAEAYRRYSHDYVRQEGKAKKLKKGVWQGSYVSASEHRKQNPRR